MVHFLYHHVPRTLGNGPNRVVTLTRPKNEKSPCHKALWHKKCTATPHQNCGADLRKLYGATSDEDDLDDDEDTYADE